MSARSETYELMAALTQRTGKQISFEDANTLRRAQMTLHRWAELECGDGNDYVSYAIERDEQTDIPYMVYHRFTVKHPERVRIADRENGALRRVRDVCARNGLYFYHQTDPRGCALYVGGDGELTDSTYNRGIACCV